MITQKRKVINFDSMLDDPSKHDLKTQTLYLMMKLLQLRLDQVPDLIEWLKSIKEETLLSMKAELKEAAADMGGDFIAKSRWFQDNYKQDLIHTYSQWRIEKYGVPEFEKVS